MHTRVPRLLRLLHRLPVLVEVLLFHHPRVVVGVETIVAVVIGRRLVLMVIVRHLGWLALVVVVTRGLRSD